MSNSWQRWQQLNGAKHQTTQAKVNNHFLYNGYPSIEISNTSLVGGQSITTTYQAAVVNKQEKDEAYIYTPSANSLSIGSVWSAKSLHMLVAEEIITIKNVDWHKYHCYLCNLQVGNTYGWFIGPEKTHVNITLKDQVLLASQQKPVLVLANGILGFQDKIMIKGRAWIVDEYDNISTDGITYYSLMPTTMSKETINAHQNESVFIETYTEPNYIIPTDQQGTSAVEIASGAKITVSTEGGYFKSSINNLQVSKHSATQVIFTVPFGIEQFTVDTKISGAVVTTTYKVVM